MGEGRWRVKGKHNQVWVCRRGEKGRGRKIPNSHKAKWLSSVHALNLKRDKRKNDGDGNKHKKSHKKEIQAERISDRELLDLLERDPQAGMEAAVGQFTGLLWKIGAKHLQNPEDIKECINTDFMQK